MRPPSPRAWRVPWVSSTPARSTAAPTSSERTATDLSLFLTGLPARGFASHGEQWSLALALRLASYEMLRRDVDAYGGDGEPVLVLDDVFASLDAGRRTALADVVAGAQQVLLTAAVDEDVPARIDRCAFPRLRFRGEP